MALLDDVRMACRVSSLNFDTELNNLINAAMKDLGVTDILDSVLVTTGTDALVKQAIITYVKMHFGINADNYYNRLKASYDEQKAQLLMATSYTDWGEADV